MNFVYLKLKKKFKLKLIVGSSLYVDLYYYTAIRANVK